LASGESGSLQLYAVQNAASTLGVEVKLVAEFEAAFKGVMQKNMLGLL
jgi:hypothetical protein